MNLGSLRFALSLALFAVGLFAQTAKRPVAKPAAEAVQNPFQAFQSFSAVLNGGAGNDHDRKIYRSGKLMRVDFDDHYRLVDLEKLTTRMVRPNACQQFAIPDVGSYPFSAYKGFKVERTPTQEKETVDGHGCKIENVSFIRPGENPVVIKMKLWEAEDLKGFPIKAEVVGANGNKFTLIYSNVSLKPPDPALFKAPANCTTLGPNPPKGGAATPAAPKNPPKTTPKPAQKPPQ